MWRIFARRKRHAPWGGRLVSAGILLPAIFFEKKVGKGLRERKKGFIFAPA
jgi:hypothetical protein